MGEKQPCRHQCQWRRRGRRCPGAEVEIALQPVEKTMVRQAVPLQPMEDYNGADIHPADCGPWWKRWMCPVGSCDSMESPCKNSLLTGTVDHGEETTQKQVFCQDLWHQGGPILEQSISEGVHPVERIRAGAVYEELQHMGRTHTGEVHEGLFPVGGTPYCSRTRVWWAKSSRDKVLWTDLNPSTFLLCLHPPEEVEKLVVKFSLGRSEEWRESFFRFVLISYYPALFNWQ